MTHPQAYYTERQALHRATLAQARRRARLLSRLRLFAMLGALALAAAAIRAGGSWYWLAAGCCLAVFLALVRIYIRAERRQRLLQHRLDITAGELKSLEGDHRTFPDGAAFVDTAHPYSFDLDLFGAGSIYQMLCRTVTYRGAQALAALLRQPGPDEASIRVQQALIRELGACPVFLEDFRAEGRMAAEEPEDYALVTGWLGGPDHFISRPAARAAMILPLAMAGLLACSALTGTLLPGIGLVVLGNWLVLGLYSKQIKAANLQIGRTARLVEQYQQLQATVAGSSFVHPQLSAIAQQARESTAQITRFRKLAHLFDSRNNGLSGPLMNSLFLFDIYCLLRLEGWRKRHRALLLQAMEAMVQLDVWVSLATYAFNRPEDVYPDFDPQGLRAANLRHPLLARQAVGNSCSLGLEEQLYLLTGANMTGKSTFIRTIGVAAVLSYAGLPVPADALSLPLMPIYTAIRITDSIQEDVSYFRAELNRIRAMMEAVQAAGRRYLVLIDEPLRGTNSGDKQQGTRAIIEKLLRQDVIGIVATHDTGLCSLAGAHPGKISNYHFESAVTPDGLSFDFRLKPGCSTSNNATVLMRQMGIIP